MKIVRAHTKALFGSGGGTVVDDGSLSTTPFASSVPCGWGRECRESGVGSGSSPRWRESRHE